MSNARAPLAVICAMAEEKSALREHMTALETRDLLGRTVTLGALEGHDVVVAESGVGKVASAVTAALLALLRWVFVILEFEQFVQKKTPMMRQRNFTGANRVSSSHEPHRTHRMVRRAKWPNLHDTAFRLQ